MADGLDLSLGLIRKFEGFRSTPYWDVNAYRVGYGTDTITDAAGRVRRVQKGDTVSREDAERDLARRARQFYNGARQAVGAAAFDGLPASAQAALTSLAYNYGSLDKLASVKKAARSGDLAALSSAVRGLGAHNNGINAKRRNSEADFILGGKGQAAAGLAKGAADVSAQAAPYSPDLSVPGVQTPSVAARVEQVEIETPKRQQQAEDTGNWFSPEGLQKQREAAKQQEETVDADDLKIKPLELDSGSSVRRRYEKQLAQAFGEYPEGMETALPNYIDDLVKSIYETV